MFSKCKILHLGYGNPKHKYMLAENGLRVEKDLGETVDERFSMSLQCTCSPEGQPYIGMHQEKRDQQVEGADSASLSCDPT